MEIVILAKKGCSGCEFTAEYLDDLGASYKEEYVPSHELNARCGKRVPGYPQILVNGKHIGSFPELEEYIEPILIPNKSRFTVFPLKYHGLWDLYKKAQMSNWTAEEIDFSSDMDDWAKMSDDERHFIKHILAFFASSDGIVYENISVNFANEVQIPEARSFYAYQEHNEMVHGETYSLLIDKYITDTDEKDKLFRAIETIPCIEQKANWALKWFDTDRHFRERLIAFACVEGIFFSGSFCAIFWLKKRGLMPALSFSNELISRDEGLHLEFAVALYKTLETPCNESIVHEIVKEAVAIETNFITEALPCKLIGMDSDKMIQYIQYVADRTLLQLGFSIIWKSENPFDFMENISLDGKTNFFEKRVGDYSKFSGADNITFDDEF